jgi:hypothetical protein
MPLYPQTGQCQNIGLTVVSNDAIISPRHFLLFGLLRQTTFVISLSLKPRLVIQDTIALEKEPILMLELANQLVYCHQ